MRLPNVQLSYKYYSDTISLYSKLFLQDRKIEHPTQITYIPISEASFTDRTLFPLLGTRPKFTSFLSIEPLEFPRETGACVR